MLERHRELGAVGAEQSLEMLSLLSGEGGRQDTPSATVGAVTDLGDEPLDRADAGQENPVADEPGRRPVDKEARPIVARPAQGVEPAGQPEAGLPIEREVAVAVAVTDQGHVPPTLPAVAIAVEGRRPARRQLLSHREQRRRPRSSTVPPSSDSGAPDVADRRARGMISGRTKATELERLLPWAWQAERLAAAVDA